MPVKALTISLKHSAGAVRIAMRILALATLCVSAAGSQAEIPGGSGIAPQAAQTPSVPAAKTPAKPASKAHKRKPVVKPVALAPMPERPSDPPPPNWPANDPAKPASVDWNGRDLRIAATNSSLQQILTDVSTATGVKLEGTAGDQRVYGNFGPAPARDVLRQLLDGSGYNVLMIGEQGQGTPRRLVLTSKASHGPSPRTAANPDATQGADDQPDEPQEQPEPPEQPAAPPPQPNQQGPQNPQNRNPQEILQELQQRQQQLQQQQQQAQPQTPN